MFDQLLSTAAQSTIPNINTMLSLGGSLYGGRRQQSAANAQAAASMKFERENMFHQNQVAADMAFRQNEFNAGEAAKSRDWNAGQAVEARDWSANQAGIERTFNAEEAAKNRDYQERMSNTQYQRATSDMKAAGINPMLAVSQGGAGNVSGAAASTSAPSSGPAQGAQASGAAASPSGLARGAQAQQFNYIASALSTAASVGQMFASIEKMGADTEQTHAITDGLRHLMSGKTTVDADGKVHVGGPGAYYRAQRDQMVSSADRAEADAERARNEAKASREAPARATADRRTAEYGVSKAKADSAMEELIYKLTGEAGSASGVERAFKMILPLLMRGMK